MLKYCCAAHVRQSGLICGGAVVSLMVVSGQDTSSHLARLQSKAQSSSARAKLEARLPGSDRRPLARGREGCPSAVTLLASPSRRGHSTQPQQSTAGSRAEDSSADGRCRMSAPVGTAAVKAMGQATSAHAALVGNVLRGPALTSALTRAQAAAVRLPTT